MKNQELGSLSLANGIVLTYRTEIVVAKSVDEFTPGDVYEVTGIEVSTDEETIHVHVANAPVEYFDFETLEDRFDSKAFVIGETKPTPESV